MILNYGTLKFNGEEEYYTVLGSFCNSKAFTIRYEPNKLTGFYGDAYRLKKLITTNELIKPIENDNRTGIRINCIKHLESLIQNHDFILIGKNDSGNLENVIKNYARKLFLKVGITENKVVHPADSNFLGFLYCKMTSK